MPHFKTSIYNIEKKNIFYKMLIWDGTESVYGKFTVFFKHGKNREVVNLFKKYIIIVLFLF